MKDDEEEDTILSSIAVHCSETPKFKCATALQVKPGPSCRAIVFNASGTILYSASNGGCIAAIDVNRGCCDETSDHSVLWRVESASPHGINALSYSEHNTYGELLVTGDDEGVIRIWSVKELNDQAENRSNLSSPFDNCLEALPKGCLASFYENSDYITAFQVSPDLKTLLATSADGVLTVIELVKSDNLKSDTSDVGVKPSKPELNTKTITGPFRLVRQSDEQGDELLSMVVLKGGKKVVVGTQEGVLNVWSWGTWGDISDRFPGHPMSIDSLLKVDDNTILTGSSDGVVRVVTIQPDKLLGVLGNHEGFPVEKLKFDGDKKILGSVSHDNFIRVWDASLLFDDGNDEIVEDDEMKDSDDDGNNVTSTANFKTSEDSADEWEDVEDSDHSMDSDDSDDEDNDNCERDDKQGRKFKTENEAFFEDL
jgi:WD40 repeat protein